MGVIKTFNGVARANIKTWNGIAIAGVKTWNGLDAVESGGSYILQENFEGTGYENTWVETGSPDEDYSASGLDMQGSQCLRCGTGSTYITGTLPSSYPVLEVYFRLRFASWPSLARNIFTMQDSAGVSQFILYKNTSTGITLRTPTSSPQVSLSTVVALDTSLHCWNRYEKATIAGNDAKMSVGFSTDGIRPTSGSTYGAVTTGTGNADINKLAFGYLSSATGVVMFIDRILVSTSAIPNNP